eukprot:scaffold39571_cov70-Phaeocystis_antarctica.AAC.11
MVLRVGRHAHVARCSHRPVLLRAREACHGPVMRQCRHSRAHVVLRPGRIGVVEYGVQVLSPSQQVTHPWVHLLRRLLQRLLQVRLAPHRSRELLGPREASQEALLGTDRLGLVQDCGELIGATEETFHVSLLVLAKAVLDLSRQLPLHCLSRMDLREYCAQLLHSCKELVGLCVVSPGPVRVVLRRERGPAMHCHAAPRSAIRPLRRRFNDCR